MYTHIYANGIIIPSIDGYVLWYNYAIDMTKIDKGNLDYEPIHIGKLIEETLRRQERTVTWLSRKIHCDRRNIYDIFNRTCIDTDLLYRLSLALQTDFFSYFSANLQLSNNQQFTPPPHNPHKSI